MENVDAGLLEVCVSVIRQRKIWTISSGVVTMRVLSKITLLRRLVGKLLTPEQ